MILVSTANFLIWNNCTQGDLFSKPLVQTELRLTQAVSTNVSQRTDLLDSIFGIYLTKNTVTFAVNSQPHSFGFFVNNNVT